MSGWPPLAAGRTADPAAGGRPGHAAALIQSPLRQLAPALGWLRLTLLTVISVTAVVATLIVAHHLWERSDPARGDDRIDRERVRLYNTATLLTLTLGVLLNYVAPLVLTLAASALLLEGSVLESTIGRPVGPVDYVLLSWLTSSIATLGSAELY